MKEFLVARIKAKRKKSGAKKKIAAKKRKALGKEAKSRVYKGKQSSQVGRVTGSQVIWSKREVKTPRESYRALILTGRIYGRGMMVPPPPPPKPTIPSVRKKQSSDAATKTIHPRAKSELRSKSRKENASLTKGG